MKRNKKIVGAFASILAFALMLSGCDLPEPETVPVDQTVPTMHKLSGNKISFEHEIEGNTITTAYDLGEYKLENWRITDSKAITMNVGVKEQKQGTELLVEHVHADVSIKSTDPQLNGLTQDSMDNDYHGTSQDGFLINKQYAYTNIFAIEGFSKDIISGWTFYCGDYGNGTITQTRLTEGNLLKSGSYGSQLVVIYNLLVKNQGESKYHIVSFEDRIMVPTAAVVDAATTQSQQTTNQENSPAPATEANKQ